MEFRGTITVIPHKCIDITVVVSAVYLQKATSNEEEYTPACSSLWTKKVSESFKHYWNTDLELRVKGGCVLRFQCP